MAYGIVDIDMAWELSEEGLRLAGTLDEKAARELVNLSCLVRAKAKAEIRFPDLEEDVEE